MNIRQRRLGLVLAAQWVALLVALLAAGGLAHWLAQPLAQDQTPAFTATWEELVPKEWDPLKRFRERNPEHSPDRIPEGDMRELALLREMRELWDNAPTRSDLNGAAVRLAGYVVPLEQALGQTREFLLVPYFGACIHSPPPPANQIVHVVLATPQTLRSMDAVWVSGTLKTQRADSPMGTSGYGVEGFAVEPYKPDTTGTKSTFPPPT